MARVTVVMDRPAVDAFRGWEGPVGRSVMRLAREARFRQIAMVGKQSGKLAKSITVGKRSKGPSGIMTTIGANAGQGRPRKGYAWFNDQGAMRHPIKPRKPGGMLVFFWPKVGRVVHLRSVRHPGNRAYHWVMRGYEAALAQWERGG